MWIVEDFVFSKLSRTKKFALVLLGPRRFLGNRAGRLGCRQQAVVRRLGRCRHTINLIGPTNKTPHSLGLVVT